MINQKDIIIKKFPCDKSWTEPELFNEKLQISDLEFQLVGFSSSLDKKSSKMVTGSSAGCRPFDSCLLEKAYFELVERMALIDPFIEHHEDSLKKEYQKSKSNGVAFHTDLSLAKENAKFEVIERDAILRYWYLNMAPAKVSILPPEICLTSEKLKDFYDIELFSFKSPFSISHSAVVTASFAFPKTPGLNFVYGFGCADSLEKSIKKSFSENLQTLAFLWGESFDPLEFSPTPSYHQSQFVTKNGVNLIREWLNSPIAYSCDDLSLLNTDFTFDDLTPEHLKGSAYIVKASNPNAIPLIFGKNYHLQQVDILNERWIHPIC